MKSNNEVWKPLKNTTYFVSSKGRIKNKNGKILKPFKDKNGYNEYKLYVNKKSIHRKEHRLVAQLFLNNYSEDLEVNHKNGIKDDNCVNNLEMVTKSENIRHSDYVLGNRIKKVYQYDLNGNLIKIWLSAKEAEKKLNFLSDKICRVCNNKRKTAYGYIWKYESEVL